MKMVIIIGKYLNSKPVIARAETIDELMANIK